MRVGVLRSPGPPHEQCRPRAATQFGRAYGRARRCGGILALLVFVTGWFVYGVLTDPERIRRQCERYLERFVDGEVVVESATFGIFDGIHLGGVRVAESGGPGAAKSGARPFFYCHNLLLKHDPLAMLVGRLVVEEVVAINPVCNLVRTDETGAYNISRIFRGPATWRKPTGKPRLPVVRLRNASLIITRESGGGRRDVDRINLSVAATPVSQSARSYSVAWKRGGDELAQGQSVFDFETLSFTDLQGGLPWMALETGMLVVATQVPDADEWFGLLGLRGDIKAEGYDVSFRGRPGGSDQLTLQLRQASMSIPVDELERSLPQAQRYLRFTDVDGEVELSQTQTDVRFSGTFHGAPCRVSATLAGQIGPHADLEDVGIAATVTCENLTLPTAGEDASPAAVRFVQRWRALRSFYNDLDPHGRVSLEVSLVKESGAGHPMRLRKGVMTILDADGSHRKFPYRVRHITGTVEVAPDRIYLRELAGEHHGAPVVVNGWLAEARWYAASELRITGRDVSLDGDLYAAVNERYRRLWDTFDLAGTADIDVDMIRAPGTAKDPAPQATTVDAHLRDARACYAGFPYPVEDITGGVTIGGDRLRVGRLTGRNGAARIVVDGYADLANEGLSDLNLRLEAERIAFDDTLLAALPDDGEAQVARFDPRGTFDLVGEIGYDPSAKRAVHDLAVTLRNARVIYSGFPATVEQVSGTVRLQPGRITVEQLTGRRGDCAVAVSGVFSSAVDRTDSHAVIRCERLVADEDLLAALPKGARSVCRDLRITGPVQTITRYEKRGPSGAVVDTLHTTIDAAGASIDLARDPENSYRLTITRGTVTVEPGQITIDDLHATHGEASVVLSGVITYDDERVEGDFVLSGKHILLDEDLRLAIPWRWRRTWNRMALTGAVDLEMDSLRYHRDRGAPSADWDFAGRLAAAGVGLEAGVRIADLVGTLAGRGSFSDAAGGLSADCALTIDSLVVHDRRVENVRGRLEKSAANGFLSLAGLAGELYGGQVSADARVRFEQNASHYDVSAILHDVDLREFVRAGKKPPANYESVAGRIDAHIFLTGTGGEPDSRRGGGKLEIRDARLYRLPLIEAILNVISFTASEEFAFQEMFAEFFITGRYVEAADVVLQGTALALVGSGTIVPATENLALKLVAVTPHRWVKVPVITEFLEGASRELIEIDVHGPLSDPVIQAKPLRGVEAALETLFEKKKPRKPKPVTPKKDGPKP